ncbi:MAG: cyclic lactone autoinducer peptide [bacterium]|jgi:cyclic lactone autoinducer peptide
MLKTLKSKILLFLVTGLSLFAAINAAGACSIMWYQPELPKALRK